MRDSDSKAIQIFVTYHLQAACPCDEFACDELVAVNVVAGSVDLSGTLYV